MVYTVCFDLKINVEVDIEADTFQEALDKAHKVEEYSLFQDPKKVVDCGKKELVAILKQDDTYTIPMKGGTELP
jgi:5'(3')-deoxyribonucleotidase